MAGEGQEWIVLVHSETGGVTRVPADAPDVLAVHRSKGWEVEDPDDERGRLPFVPVPAVDTDGDGWVVLHHPDLPTGQNVVPNNPDALQGAFDAGWRLPDVEDHDAVLEQLRDLRGGSAAGATKAEREEAEQRAALAAATTDDPSGAEPAGDAEKE